MPDIQIQLPNNSEDCIPIDHYYNSAIVIVKEGKYSKLRLECIRNDYVFFDWGFQDDGTSNFFNDPSEIHLAKDEENIKLYHTFFDGQTSFSLSNIQAPYSYSLYHADGALLDRAENLKKGNF